MTLTPSSAFALDGCDGVMDTGEIELESYIEWNTFKSNVDGLSEEALEELRSAEDRGILPEMYPVGTNKVVIKTDIGFYPFLINSDGSYTSMTNVIRYAHIGSSKDNYIGTDAVNSGASDYFCCPLTSVNDYGYYGDDFYVMCTNSINPWTLDSSNIHSQCQKQGTVSSSDLPSGRVLFKLSASDSNSFQVAFHGYSTAGSATRGLVSSYWGDTSFFSISHTYNSSGYADVYRIMEYDFSKGLLNQGPSNCTVVSECAPYSGSVSAVGGRFSTNRASIKVDRDSGYPYGKFKYGSGADNDDYIIWDYIYGWYDGDDNGVRTVSPFAGFVNMGDRLYGTRLYYRYKSSQNSNDVGTGSVKTAWGTSKNVGPSQLSIDQVNQLSKKLAVACNRNGIPFYALNTKTSNINYTTDSLTFYSSRLSSKHTDGKTYHDGRLVLYKPAKPNLGTDGKYILGQTKTISVSGGMSKNATRLTFSNISLGSDAKIEIYGVNASGGTTLLETITNSKNSVGTYTTPLYPHGEVQIKFTGGTSDSGRGEGFVLAKAEHGKFGVIDGDYTVENVGKVSLPKVGYSGLTKKSIPSKGQKQHSTSVTLNYSTVGTTRTLVKLKSNVYVEGGRSYTYVNNYNSTATSYTPGNRSSYLQLKDPYTGTTYNLTTPSSGWNTSFTGPSGYYDVYGYLYNSGTYYNWTLTFDCTEYETESATVTDNITVSNYDYALSDFDAEEYIFTVDNIDGVHSGYYTLLLEGLDLDVGDSIRMTVSGSDNFLNRNSSSVDIYQSGSTSLSSNDYSGRIDLSTGDRMAVIQTAGIVDIRFTNSYYDNTTYQMKSGDSIKITVYKRKYRESLELGYDELYNKTTQTTLGKSPDGTTGLVYNYSVVPGGSTHSSAYRFIIGGSTYYFANAVTDKQQLITSQEYDRYLTYYLYSSNYADYISDETKLTLDVYDTAYHRVVVGTRYKVGTIPINFIQKDGYEIVDSKLKIDFEAFQGYFMLKYNGKTILDYTNVSSGLTKGLNLTESYDGTEIEVWASLYGAGDAYRTDDYDITFTLSHTYKDISEDILNYYALDSTTTYSYNIIALDSHFTNVVIKEYNVPDGMTLTIGGVTITKDTTETGWTNKTEIPIRLTIKGSPTYGIYKEPSIAEVIDYELQTKSIYDATSKESHTGVNLNQFKATTTTNSSGDTVNTCSYSSSTSITAATNAYVKIVSSLGLAIYNSSSRTEVSGSISGLRGLSTISAYNYTNESFGDMGYIPTSSSTVTLNFSTVESVTWDGFNCPTGYAIKDWYMIKASNIPDSKIKTYQDGYQTIATGTTKFGDIALKELADAGYTKVQILNNVPITKWNAESYSSSSNYYGTKTYGELYLTNSSGTEVLQGAFGTATINPNSYKYFRFNPKVTVSATSVASGYGDAPTVYWTKYIGPYLNECGMTEYKEGWKYYLPLIHIDGVIIDGTCYNTELTENVTVGNLYNTTNPAKGPDGTAGGSFKLTMWTGDTQFEDGRYGVAKLGQDLYYSNQWYSTVQRVDVYRDYADGTTKNLAMVPVSGTDSFFITTGGINGINEEPPSVYHIGNDLMYIPGKAVDSRTEGNAGISMAWLRTGHWHLKGRPDEIEGITIGGVQHPIKDMDDNEQADTQIIVPELDMDAESWTVGHKIKDGRVTEEKLSEDVKDKINEINLGSVTFIKDDGDQYKMLPVRNVYDSSLGYIADCTLSFGGHEIEMFSQGSDQIGIFIDGSIVGTKNTGGSVSSKLGKGSYVFKGTTTQGDREINIVLQVDIIERPTVETTTTIEF